MPPKLDTLPTELILEIFTHLDYVSLRIFFLSCPSFAAIINRYSRTPTSALSAILFKDTRILHGGACKGQDDIPFQIHPVFQCLQLRTPTSPLTVENLGWHNPISGAFHPIRQACEVLEECATYPAIHRGSIGVEWVDDCYVWKGVRGKGKAITVLRVLEALEEIAMRGDIRQLRFDNGPRPFMLVSCTRNEAEGVPGNRPMITFWLDIRQEELEEEEEENLEPPALEVRPETEGSAVKWRCVVL